MSLIPIAQVLLPIGCAVGAAWLLARHWKNFERWLDRTHELL